jgi:hypothetical protein
LLAHDVDSAECPGFLAFFDKGADEGDTDFLHEIPAACFSDGAELRVEDGGGLVDAFGGQGLANAGGGGFAGTASRASRSSGSPGATPRGSAPRSPRRGPPPAGSGGRAAAGAASRRRPRSAGSGRRARSGTCPPPPAARAPAATRDDRGPQHPPALSTGTARELHRVCSELAAPRTIAAEVAQRVTWWRNPRKSRSKDSGARRGA